MAVDRKLTAGKRRTIVKLYHSRVSKGYSSVFVINLLSEKYGVSVSYIYRLLRIDRKQTGLRSGATLQV